MEYKIVRNKFWNGQDKSEEKGSNEVIQYSFDNRGFRHAILRAFNDLTQRTMERNDSENPVPRKDLCDYVCDEDNYKDGKKSFLTLLKEYFSLEQNTDNSEIYNDFNEWHKLACESIKSCLDHYYKEDSVSYGKEQKIVNMTLKGIYCLEGSEEHVNKFSNCHMTLDSFTLEWFYRCCNNEKYKHDDFAKEIGRKNLPVWSNIEKDTIELVDENTKKKDKFHVWGYYDIQEKIASLVKSIELEKDFSVTPFEAEFFIWPQMQMTIAAEAIYSNLLDNSDERNLKEFKAKALSEKYKLLKDLFNKNDFEDPNFI